MTQHATLHGTVIVPMGPYLLGLPNEIINMVAQNAENDDLNNLRLTCKRIQDAVRPEFVFRNFQERSHVLSLFGMQELAKITADEHFGACVKTVIFNITTDSEPSTPSSGPSFVDQDQFTKLVEKIFSNIRHHQEEKNYKISIGFTDSYPYQGKGSCSDAIYRIAEKPSYGWYDLKLNRRAPKPPHIFTTLLASRRGRYLRSLGMITVGDAMSRIIPLAIESGCSVAALDLRFVGRLHYTSRALNIHSPSVHDALNDVKTPADWNLKISVLDIGRTELSTITHTTADKKLKFQNFCLGHLDISQAFAYAYHVVACRLAYEFEELEMVNCFISDAKVMVEQINELIEFNNKIASPAKLEKVVIHGLWVWDNLDWDQIFLALSEVKTLKCCSVQGLSIAPEDEDEENEVEEDQDDDEGEESENGVGEDGDNDDAKGGDEIGETVDDDAGESETGEPDPKKELARLTEALAGVSIVINEACGHNVSRGLLDLAKKLAMRT